MATALVTGSNRGIGLELCRQLAARKQHVIAVCRSPSADLEALAVRVESGVDITDVRAVDGLARRLEGTRIDVLVNNAGVLNVGETWDMPDADVRRMVEVNVLGVMWGCHAAVPVMPRGHIINIASMSGITPTPGLAVYGATKHAVVGYSLSLAGELRQARSDLGGDMGGGDPHAPERPPGLEAAFKKSVTFPGAESDFASIP